MRCTEHTLQIRIRDVLKKGRAEKFFTKLRKLAQHLRSPHTDGILKRRASKGMLIDMPTRWGSTILMLQRLADLKCFVQDLGSHESYLIESEWAEVKMMVEATNTSRSNNLFSKTRSHSGRMPASLEKVMFKLEKLDNNLASALATALQSREELLVRKEAFLTAVWISGVC